MQSGGEDMAIVDQREKQIARAEKGAAIERVRKAQALEQEAKKEVDPEMKKEIEREADEVRLG